MVTVTTDEGDEFVHFDEYEDCVLAIELMASKIVIVRNSPTQWKWVIVGMQNAVQSAMVLALSGTDGCGALDDRSQRLNREWFDNPSNIRPRRRMAEYGVLLERVQRQDLMEGPVPVLTSDDQRNLERLNELRRQFAHYNPTGWGIQISYMLNIMPVALNTFEHLVVTQGRPSIHFTPEHNSQLERALSDARSALKLLRDSA